MKGNQGLEALAALCGGQTDAPTEIARAAAEASRARDTAFGDSSGSSGVATSQGPQQIQGRPDVPSQLAQRPALSGNQQSPLVNMTPQQWQQAIAAASSTLQQGNVSNSSLTAQSLLLSGLSNQGLGENPFSTMQQLALHQYIQAQANFNAQKAAAAQTLGAYGDPNQHAIMMAIAAGKAQQMQQQSHASPPPPTQQQVIPSASHAQRANNNSPNLSQETSVASSSSSPEQTSAPPRPTTVTTVMTKSMKPPSPPSCQSVLSLSSRPTLSTSGLSNQGKSHQTIAPMPGGKMLPNSDTVPSSNGGNGENKKHQKRAANRRSAQLSRKRKKQFIEELKDENDELRRKEHILRSIPDLIVVFDSSGKLAFVSQSVSRILDIDPEDLEGTSFWDRLCEDSVRLLKAAFMDALAARQSDSDTAPLGSGVWELRLVDKNSNFIIVTLNGVVHFSGEVPECVCCIRPRDQQPIQNLHKERKTKEVNAAPSRMVSSSGASRTSDDATNSDDSQPRICVAPSQSVMRSDNSTGDDSTGEDSSPQEEENTVRKKVRRDVRVARVANDIVRMIDADSRCEVSESSDCDDGIVSN